MTAEIYAGLELRNQNAFKNSLRFPVGYTMENITEIVFNYFDIDAKIAFSKSRRQEHVNPRHIAMYFIRKKINKSTLTIGWFFNRDHSTVIASTQKVEDFMSIDYRYKMHIDAIEELL